MKWYAVINYCIIKVPTLAWEDLAAQTQLLRIFPANENAPPQQPKKKKKEKKHR